MQANGPSRAKTDTARCRDKWLTCYGRDKTPENFPGVLSFHHTRSGMEDREKRGGALRVRGISWLRAGPKSTARLVNAEPRDPFHPSGANPLGPSGL